MADNIDISGDSEAEPIDDDYARHNRQYVKTNMPTVDYSQPQPCYIYGPDGRVIKRVEPVEPPFGFNR
ncbi:MAG: hypothetical protein WC891_02915 [Actinomycetota bacterium]